MSTVAVVGASGATGSLVVDRLADAGHEVIAICRSRPGVLPQGARHAATDVLDPGAVTRALEGAEAVVVTLGISDNPLLVRLRGARSTADDVRSRGTRHVVAAMREHGARRLVVLSTYGIGDSAAGLSPSMRVIVAGLLAPQFRDHAAQEEVVTTSGLDWTIARPVNLVDEDRPPVVADAAMRTVSMKVGRSQVAQQLARWASGAEDLHATIALSS